MGGKDLSVRMLGAVRSCQDIINVAQELRCGAVGVIRASHAELLDISLEEVGDAAEKLVAHLDETRIGAAET